MRPGAYALAAAVLLAPLPRLAAQQAHTPPQMLHPAAGKQDCLSCHGAGANAHVISVPAAHHFANGACGMCHKPGTVVPPAIKHAADDAHADCRKCHVQPAAATAAAAPAPAPAPGAAPAPPASHEKFDAATCRMCHDAAAASGAPGGR